MRYNCLSRDTKCVVMMHSRRNMSHDDPNQSHLARNPRSINFISDNQSDKSNSLENSDTIRNRTPYIHSEESPSGTGIEIVQNTAWNRVGKTRKRNNSNRLSVISFVITIGFIISYIPHVTLVILRTVIVDMEHDLNTATLILYNICLRSPMLNTYLCTGPWT